MVDLSDIKGDIVELQGEVKNLNRSIRSVSKIETHEVDFHGDPLTVKLMTFVITEPCISTCGKFV